MENVAIKGRGGNDVQHKNWKGKILRIWITIIRHGGGGHEVQESWPYLPNATPWINCMSVWEWLEWERKCSETVVGLDLMLVLSTARLCSLNLSLGRHLVSPIYCKLQRLHWTMYITFLGGCPKRCSNIRRGCPKRYGFRNGDAQNAVTGVRLCVYARGFRARLVHKI